MLDTSQDLDGRALPPAGACRTFSWLVFYRCIIRNCLLGIGRRGGCVRGPGSPARRD